MLWKTESFGIDSFSSERRGEGSSDEFWPTIRCSCPFNNSGSTPGIDNPMKPYSEKGAAEESYASKGQFKGGFSRVPLKVGLCGRVGGLWSVIEVFEFKDEFGTGELYSCDNSEEPYPTL